MATENPRVWFKSISLENVRSFGAKQTIYFTSDGTKDGELAQWNVILGDNGTGKTTVLKGLSLESVAVSRTFDAAAAGFNRDFMMRDEQLDMHIWTEWQIGTDTVFKHHSTRTRNYNVASEMLGKYEFQVGEKHGPIRQFQLFGYGANRRISESGIAEESINHVKSIFDESISLTNAEEWLVQSEYISLKEPVFKARFDTALEILKKLFRNEVSDIFIKTSTGTPKVFFKTHYGDVRLHELSLGYKTLIAWMVDFAKGLLDRYSDSPDPLAEPAVCLVDEIDLHLHPKFQRSIIKFLTETFPNTQFIVTAHSPLIVVAAEERPLDANIILLKREGSQTVVVNEPVDVSKWSVDQILNSDLFGYVPPRSETITELRNERDTLLAKPKQTEKEKARLAELDEKIGFVPFGQDQTEIKAETIIQQLANVLRKQQQPQ